MSDLFFSIRRFLAIRFKNNLEIWPWRILDLKFEIAGGLTVPVKNRPDWNTFNEIFVRGDYDFAIQQSLQNRVNGDKVFKFIDLGANVGYFTLRVIDLILKNTKGSLPFEGTLIEGSPQVYKELQDRFKNQSIINQEIKVIHGLVGKREGKAKIFESSNYITNSLSSKSSFRKNIGGTLVSYTDISLLFNNESNIDLLKCDIEGSELEFLENYEDLLKKVKVAVFELHHDKCDTEKCIGIIQRNGLVNQKTIFNYGNSCSMIVFWR